MTRERAGALFVPWDGTFLLHMDRIVQLAAKTRLAGMYGQRRYVDIGGLTISPSLLQRADQVIE